MFLQQHCFKQSLHQMMTVFRLGIGAKASLPLIQSVQQYLKIPPDFVGLSSLCGIAISTGMLLGPHVGYFLCIPSCLMENVQD